MKDTHTHHIIPKYMGGTDDPDNLVELTVIDHAIAHLVRWKMFGDDRDKWAWNVLSGRSERNDSEFCRETQMKLLEKGVHNWQLKNGSDFEHVRKGRSERMKGNTLGALRNITSEYRAIQAEGAKGNTNVRGRVWVVNDITKERRRISKSETIPKGFRRGMHAI
jgi:hypothetical protein